MPNTAISLADLSAEGIRLQPPESVAITREMIARVLRDQLPGIPSADVLRFSPDGNIVIKGPVAAGRSVDRAARLLDSLLPELGSSTGLRVPGALRLVVARALGTLDLPAYASLEQFSTAIERFAAPDPRAVAGSLWDRWSAAHSSRTMALEPPAELTISDVRRARRATGLTLTEISIRSRIPVSLLRELEWGYFVNWPADHYGRAQLVRYARAAGLDDEVVLNAVWPVLQDAIRARAAVSTPMDSPATVPLIETRLVKVGPTALVARAERPPRVRRLLAVLAIPALLAVAALPMVFSGDGPGVSQAEAPQAGSDHGLAAPVAARQPAESAAALPPTSEPSAPAKSARPLKRTPPPDARPDEPGPRPAALSADVAFSPAFASTGSAMFFHAGAGDSSALMRADTDATGAVLRVTSIVDDSARNFHARPSPDGRMIAFDSDRDGERAVYVADGQGRSVRRVSGEGFAAVPSWSPDGRRLAFVRAEPEKPRVWNLWLLDLATGETTRLTSHRVGQPWGAAWFPDGKRIAYSHEDRLIVRTLDGRSEQIYPSPRKGRLLRTPAVSPDGHTIIFQLYRDGAWILDLEDGSMRRILSDPTAEEFTWAPDGRKVAYHSRRTGDWNVWLMAAR